MFKKLVIVTAVLAASSSVAFAGGNYKGDYKGEQMAPAPCVAPAFAAGPYVGVSVGPMINTSGNTNYEGILGSLSVGYAQMLTPEWYLAGEIFGQGNSQVYDNSDVSDNSSKTSWGYGASIIPGYMVTDHVLGFLRLGGTETRFSDQDVNKGGWHVGLGAQTNVYQNWDIRAEYTYTYYGDVSGLGKTQSNQATIGLVYKFV